jgi:hypothetical protein
MPSASGTEDDQRRAAGFGGQGMSGIIADELGDDRDVGVLGVPPVERTLEGPAREGLGHGRGTVDRFQVRRRVRGPGVYGGERDATLSGGLEREPERRAVGGGAVDADDDSRRSKGPPRGSRRLDDDHRAGCVRGQLNRHRPGQ